jgi:hypothetical protein
MSQQFARTLSEDEQVDYVNRVIKDSRNENRNR